MLNMIADSATTLGFCRSLVLGEVMFLVLPPLQLCDNVHSSLCASYNLPESYFIGTAPAAVLRIGCAGVKGHQKKGRCFHLCHGIDPQSHTWYYLRVSYVSYPCQSYPIGTHRRYAGTIGIVGRKGQTPMLIRTVKHVRMSLP